MSGKLLPDPLPRNFAVGSTRIKLVRGDGTELELPLWYHILVVCRKWKFSYTRAKTAR